MEDKKSNKEKHIPGADANLESLFVIVENIGIGVLLLDTKGNTIYVNEKIKMILGSKDVSEKNVLEKLQELFPKYNVREVISQCTKKDESQEIPEAEIDGKIYDITLTCLYGKKRSSTGYLILIRDVTEEKMLERSKSEFVAIASHQLRTPITVTRGNVEMLLDGTFGKLSEGQREILLQVLQADQRLINLVNDMLDVSKIDRGDFELELENLSLEEVLKPIMEELNEYAEKNKVKLIYKKPNEKLPLVVVDRVRIRQVLQNLLSNAIHYSKHPGYVEISFSLSHNMIESRITDNGIGIPRAEQSKIFNRFYRASNAVKFSEVGTGLGLYIVKAIVKELGGKIWFESVENEGTTFYFTIPIAQNSATL